MVQVPEQKGKPFDSCLQDGPRQSRADLAVCAAVGVLDADPEPAGPSPTSEVDTLVSWRHSSGWLVRGSPAPAPPDHLGSK